MIDILHVANASEGHLLFDVVAEPVAANSVAESSDKNINPVSFRMQK